MRIKEGISLNGDEGVYEFTEISILDETGKEAFSLCVRDGELRLAANVDLRTGIRGVLVVKPVAANVIGIGRE